MTFNLAGRLAVAAALVSPLGPALPVSARAAQWTLPGAEPVPPALLARLTRAATAKEGSYEPRSHHLSEDGSPLFTNRLVLESSPYLLQHAHNPVNWYPWGEEAFAAARQLDRPVLLSVGYSTCHWCHVMERESFEDLEIARYLNENFVAIKVDREERPDVDSIYMSAVQMLTGRGGWPLNVWLDTAGNPFWGGTYFPPRDGDRGISRGFLTYLREIRRSWDTSPERIRAAGERLGEAVRRHLEASPGAPIALPGNGLLERAVDAFRERFDPEHGGARGEPKFPSSFPVLLLLRHHARTGDPESREMALFTLGRMAAGGIHDQVGGGFHRYSTDRRWLVPHFEKMLYDNALLARAYLEGYQLSGDPSLAATARGILDYLAREMTSASGGFFSATDADSRGPDGHDEEGLYFTWTLDELQEVLGPRRAAIVAAAYGVTAAGNFEGRSILHRAEDREVVAARFGLERDALKVLLEEALDDLYAARRHRSPPLLDDKVLTSWNGLTISAFAVAGRMLDDEAYLERAAGAARFLLEHSLREGRLLRSHREGETSEEAFLDDYAFLIAGLLDLYEATWDAALLAAALDLQKIQDRYYGDPRGGYYLVPSDHEELLAREKPVFDGAEPSGNSVALMNLLRLAELTGEDRYRAAADALLAALAPRLEGAPTVTPHLLLGLDFRLGRPKEIVLVAPREKDQVEPFLAALRAIYLPHHVLVAAAEGDHLEAQEALLPLLEGKRALDDLPTAYVCENRVCLRPTTEVDEFERQLRAEPVAFEPAAAKD